MAREHTNHRSMKMVADWQDRSFRQQGRFNLALLLAVLAAMVTTALFFFWSKQENHLLVVDNNMKYLQVCGIQEADRVDDALAEGMTLASSIAERYATIAEKLPGTSVTDRLSLLADTRLFDRIGHISADGEDITLEGNADVADRDYFQRGMRGETGYEFLRASRVTGRPCVVFCAPVREAGQIVGVMTGFYETARLNSLFTMEVYSYSPEAYLLEGDGSVVACSGHDFPSGNMLAPLSGYEFVGEVDDAAIREAIAHHDRTSIMFEFLNAEDEPCVGVITQLQSCDWMILSLLPGSASTTRRRRSTAPTRPCRKPSTPPSSPATRRPPSSPT